MRRVCFIGLTASTLAALSTPVAAAAVFGLVGSDRIVTFESADPATITSNLAIVGLGAGEILTGIDLRPLDSTLYSVSTSGNVYRLAYSDGSYAATFAGVVQTFPPPGTAIPITGSNFGIDFAPADRIRLVSDLDQNLRINPLNGGAASDALINDGVGGRPWDVVGVAFTNGSVSGAPFYGIDGVSASLLRGAMFGVYSNTNLASVAFDPLGISLTSLSDVGFDILFADGINRAFLSADDSFYGVDLTTGRATLIGAIGIADIRGITTAVAVPEPASWAMLVAGFGLAGAAVRRRERHGGRQKLHARSAAC